MYLRRRIDSCPDACCLISDFFHQGFSSKARFGFRRGKTTRDQLKEAAFEPATDTAIKSNHYYMLIKCGVTMLHNLRFILSATG